MKNGKKLLAALLLVVLVFTLAACGSEGIVGKWEMDLESVLKHSGMSMEEYNQAKPYLGEVSATLEFTKDGRAIACMTAMGETETDETTYTVDGNKITFSDGSGFTFEVKGKTLTMNMDGMILTLKKIK